MPCIRNHNTEDLESDVDARNQQNSETRTYETIAQCNASAHTLDLYLPALLWRRN